MSDERLAAAIRDVFEQRHIPSPGVEARVVAAIPWDAGPERKASMPRLAGAFAAAMAIVIVATLVAPQVFNSRFHFGPRLPSPASKSLINTDPRCSGVALLPERTYPKIAVYRWRQSGSGFVAVPTGLDGSLATAAHFDPISSHLGDDRVIVYFNAKGQTLLDELTAELAIPRTVGPMTDSPNHHIPVLVGLSVQQVAHWNDPLIYQKALMPVEQGGNLLSNGLVLEPLSGNELVIYFGTDLLTACSLTASLRADAQTPNPLTTGSCIEHPLGATTGPLNDNFKVIVRVPNGWTAEVPVNPHETELLLLAAPPNYSNQPTKIYLHSLIGYYPSEPLEEVAAQYYGPPGQSQSRQLVGELTRCAVGTDDAVFFNYRQGDHVGYLVLFFHYHYLYGLQLEGAGGVDQRALKDAKRILGSWTWTIATPPAR